MKKIFQWILIAGLLAPLQSCAQHGDVLEPALFQTGMEADENEQLVDVRTFEEFTGGHIPGATNIDFYDPAFRARIGKLDPAQPVYVYCKSGGRSAKAAQIFRELGFTQVIDLDGGFTAWQQGGLPVEF